MKRITVNSNIIVKGRHCQAGDTIETDDQTAALLIGSSLAVEAPAAAPKPAPAVEVKKPITKSQKPKAIFKKVD